MSVKFLGPACTLLALWFTAAAALANPLPSSVHGLVVTTPGLNTAEAKSYATQHDRYLLSDYLETTRPGDDHDQMLKTKLERAQRAWLGGEVETARAEFRSLTELNLKADWRQPQREVIQTAFLRMAQSSESVTEREGWLESAARLYGDIAPNADLFPPPLMSEFEATKKRQTMTEIELADVFADFRYVLIDGRKIEIATEPRVQLAPGLHRLTALSDSHEPVTEFMTAAQLRVLRLSPPALTEGICDGAKLRSRSALPSNVDVEIYSGSACPSKITNILNESRLLTAESEPFVPSAPRAREKDHTWLWVAGAAIVAGAAYAIANQHESSPQTTHRSGF